MLPRALIVCGLAFASMAFAALGPANDRVTIQPLSIPPNGKPGFTLQPETQTGIRFTNHLSDQSVAENQIRLIGSGVALGDVDGDGWCDVFLCRLEGGNALYRNLGSWKFADITASAGVACSNQYSTGATLADLDGDRDLDLLVNGLGVGTRCFLNNGQGRFTEHNSGLLQKYSATSMALADIDGNGTLDLYVANYRTTTIRSTGLQLLNVNGRRTLRPEDREGYEITPEGLILEHAEPDVLYLNDGKGNFAPVSWNRFIGHDGKPLARGDRDWGLSVIFRDLNGDSSPDIYVCNDFWSDDAVWINNGAGQFRALSNTALRTTSTFSMGVDCADINRDGIDDFVVLDMRSREHVRRMTQRAMIGGTPTLPQIEERLQTERNTLQLGRGDGTYAEIAQLAGLQASEWSWAAAFIDVDLDGYEDLLVTTGHGFDSQDVDTEERLARIPRRPGEKVGEQILRFPRLHVPNQAFRNRGDLTFESAADAWNFNAVGVSHGMAHADLDNDGDSDVVVNNLNAFAGLYRNDSPAARVAIRLRGAGLNTSGIGARIKMNGGKIAQSQEMMAGGRYLSSDAAERVFAAWSATNRFTVEVTWRSGKLSSISNVPANSLVTIDESTAVERPQNKVPHASPLFRDVSSLLQHRHVDEPFDDFGVQPLLSRRLSHSGPGVSWADLDADGRDDLLVTSGRGGELGLFYNRGDRFERGLGLPRAEQDQPSAIVAGPTLILGTSNYERPGGQDSSLAAIKKLGEAFTSTVLRKLASNLGPIAVADIDTDGDLDIFAGGRCKPGRYPEAADSLLWKANASGGHDAQVLPSLGPVNGALFTDLDSDGLPELIVACEWGPVKILRQTQGVFAVWDPRVIGETLSSTSKMSSLSGWWQGVTAGDFDGDGRMDIAASNWGRNSPYESYVRDGIRVYYGDFLGAGRIDLVEAYVANGRVVPWRDLETLSRSMPWLRQRLPSNQAFARATVSEVLGEHFARSTELKVNWLSSAVFLNRGDHFECRTLPIEAQFAPAFGISSADFNGDGREDLFLAQNFSPTDGEVSRYDAGLGLILRGDGRGDFSTMSANDSGVRIHGDQRGAAVADYDGDGRVDLAVGQNGADTKLFRNERAVPGLRVRLRGNVGNPNGIGAVIRRGNGRAQELHAGSGYCSQDSATVVVSGSGSVISVRWPGGKQTKSTVPTGARAVTIDHTGKISLD